MDEPHIQPPRGQHRQPCRSNDAISLLHCMPVSLAEGGAGLGTGWGEQVALALLSDAGFGPVDVHDAPGDPATRSSLRTDPSDHGAGC